MDKLTEELIELGLGNIIERNVEQQLTQDTIYLQDMQDVARIKEQIDEFGLSEQQKLTVEDYMACLMSANARACDVAYMAGVRSTFLFLDSLKK